MAPHEITQLNNHSMGFILQTGQQRTIYYAADLSTVEPFLTACSRRIIMDEQAEQFHVTVKFSGEDKFGEFIIYLTRPRLKLCDFSSTLIKCHIFCIVKYSNSTTAKTCRLFTISRSTSSSNNYKCCKQPQLEHLLEK